MAKDKGVAVDRRTVLLGGASTIAAGTIPEGASASCTNPPCTGADLYFKGAVYMDPTYLDTFKDRYSKAEVGKVHDIVTTMWPTKADRDTKMKWGLYQMEVEKDPTKWGCTPQKGKIAYDNWKYFAADARFDLEKQAPNLKQPKNAMDPFDTTRVAKNAIEHLDEVVRIALWDHAVPISVCVGKKRNRHHGLTTEWQPAPNPGANPNLQLKGLTITVDCPEGGWKGYAWWRTSSSSEHITRFAATWQVPPAPKNDDGQIIFVFNGLESVNSQSVPGGILQAVLQWKGGYWYVRNWYVRADFDPDAFPDPPDPTVEMPQANLDTERRCYTKAIQVAPGDAIIGTIKGGKDPSTGKFNYHSTVQAKGQQEDLPMADIPELVYAVCAVESYDIQDRQKNYPANPITISEIDLQVDPTPPEPINWSTNRNVGHDFKTSSGDGGLTIEFKLRQPGE
jgi:hypothetical protein